MQARSISVDSRVPALIVTIPRLTRIEGRGTLAVLPDPAGPASAVIVPISTSAAMET